METITGCMLGTRFLLAYLKTAFPGFRAVRSGLSWTDYLTVWRKAIEEYPTAGGVTLLCFATSPLVVGLFLFNVYQIWAGITTNESNKWTDLKLDIKEDMVRRKLLDPNRKVNARIEPLEVDWPLQPKQIIAFTDEIPASEASSVWHPIRAARWDDLHNIYDIGFWRNLGDIFWTRKHLERNFSVNRHES
jgi:hypothetical protein